MSFIPGAFDPTAYSAAFDVGHYVYGVTTDKPALTTITSSIPALAAVTTAKPSLDDITS